MYNRYVPGSRGYTRVRVDEEPLKQRQKDAKGSVNQSNTATHTGTHKENQVPLSGVFGGESKNAGIAGILKSLHLEGLDSGDILLLLIILLVFMEGDNIELVITLGLMLLLGLGDDGKKIKTSEDLCRPAE